MGYGGGINLYGYVENNPANEDDPSGLREGTIPPTYPQPAPSHDPKPEHGITLQDIIQQIGADNPFPEFNSPPPELDQPIYNGLRQSPNYPTGFKPRPGDQGTLHNMNNKELESKLNAWEPGPWKKIYQDGYNSAGRRISIHFNRCPSGKVFNVKVKSGWSNPFTLIFVRFRWELRS